MNKRIQQKIGQLEQYLGELESIMPDSFQSYQKSLEKKAACERYVEKIVEAACDTAFLVIKHKKLRVPEDDADAFKIIFEDGIIDENLMKVLQSAKGMRNVIAHQYSRIDDQIVFESISSELGKDMALFVKRIRVYLK